MAGEANLSTSPWIVGKPSGDQAVPHADLRKSLEIYEASLKLGARIPTRMSAASSLNMRPCRVMERSHQEKLSAEQVRSFEVCCRGCGDPRVGRQSQELVANSPAARKVSAGAGAVGARRRGQGSRCALRGYRDLCRTRRCSRARQRKQCSSNHLTLR